MSDSDTYVLASAVAFMFIWGAINRVASAVDRVGAELEKLRKLAERGR